MIRLQFPSEREAIEYAKEHGISLDRVELPSEDEYCYIEIDQLTRIEQTGSNQRKSSIASRLGDYTGVGYILQVDWERHQFDTGRSSPRLTSDFREAKVFFSKEDAARSSRYSTARRIVRKVEIKKGKIIRFADKN